MIVCSVKDLLVIVLKKFYLIILGILLFGMLAVFNAQASYQAASDNYSTYVENGEISDSCVWFAKCSSKIRSGAQADKDAASFVSCLLQDNILRNNVGLNQSLVVRSINNYILFESSTLSGSEVGEQVELIKKVLQIPMIEEDIEVEYGKESFEGQESFEKKIMEKPGENIQKLKVCIRGGVLGILVSVFLILVMEYVKSNKKADREQGENECKEYL